MKLFVTREYSKKVGVFQTVNERDILGNGNKNTRHIVIFIKQSIVSIY